MLRRAFVIAAVVASLDGWMAGRLVADEVHGLTYKEDVAEDVRAYDEGTSGDDGLVRIVNRSDRTTFRITQVLIYDCVNVFGASCGVIRSGWYLPPRTEVVITIMDNSESYVDSEGQRQGPLCGICWKTKIEYEPAVPQ